MLNHSAARIAVILLYFIVCTACGNPRDTGAQSSNPPSDVSTADNVNFLGGGTNPPEIPRQEEPYHSPTLSTPPPPTALTWVPSIGQAVRIIERDDKLKILAWFRSSSCVDCPAIERDVFANPDVIAASKGWVFVKVDVDANKEAAEYYLAGASPPAFLAIDKKGNTYRRKFGTVTVEEFVTMLKTWH